MLSPRRAFLWVAVVFHRRADARPLRTRHAVELWLLALALGLCKPVYWVLTALLLALPLRSFGTRRRQGRVLLGIVVGSLLPALAWYVYASRFDGPTPVFADSEAQLALLRADPLAVARVLLESVRVETVRWLQQFIGVLGWLDTPLPAFVYWLLPPLLCGVALSETEPAGGIGWRERSLLLAIPLACWLATMLIAFVSWTAPGEGVVRSFQGRYLIPVAPLLAMAMQRRRAAGVPQWAARVAVAASLGCLLVALATAIAGSHS